MEKGFWDLALSAFSEVSGWGSNFLPPAMSLPTTKEGLPSRGPPLSPVYRPVVFRLKVS